LLPRFSTTFKGHIDKAKQEIAKEPADAPWTNRLPFDMDRRVLLQGADGRQTEISELLAQLACNSVVAIVCYLEVIH
jgi:hypothetical protein